MRAVFLRILEANDKEAALRTAILGPEFAVSCKRFDEDPATFANVPGSPFAYWVSTTVRGLFARHKSFEADGRKALGGLKTLLDERFVRAWWEVDSGARSSWPSLAKGGAFSPYHADLFLCVNWRSRGQDISWYGYERRPREGFGAASRGIEAYFRPGLTWARRTQGGLSLRAMSAGCIFADKGPAAFVANDNSVDLLALLAITNSQPFGVLVNLQMAFGSYEVGVIQRTPVPNLTPGDQSALATLARRAWSLKRSLDTRTENSHAFNLPGLLQSPTGTLTARAAAWADRVYATETELAAIQAEIDDRCFDLYGVNDEDRKAITEGFGGTGAADPSDEASDTPAPGVETPGYHPPVAFATDRESTPGTVAPSVAKPPQDGRRGFQAPADSLTLSPADSPADSPVGSPAESLLSASGIKRPLTPSSSEEGEQGDDDSESSAVDTAALTAELLSWSVGVAFGRFDVRLATGERPLPPEPEPFDPLPICSPGMLTGADGLPLAAPPPGYPIAFPPDGILLDDPGHPRDLFAAARAVFDVVFGKDADARWQEGAEILDPKNHDLRAFFARTFFEQHIKRYSKSRRKAPIHWQLTAPSASYSIWLYAHRLTPDTFFHLLNEVITPKLEHEERKLLSFIQEHGPNPTASQRKVSTSQEAFVEELRAFRDEIARVAPLWKPDLDDGVLLTMAPLWRLVPQHRAWQKELKTAWDSLCAGDYDWAHLAMHLWPERVVPKCATDRSLAIAHGLEEVFWEEGVNGKWTARKTPLTPIAELVASRTSPAVKAALKDLFEAGDVTSGGRKPKLNRKRAGG